MTNPVALSLRGLIPLSSQAARLPGWNLRFLGRGGMASAEPEPEDADALIHGVLHLLTLKDLRELDRIEGGYLRKQCVVEVTEADGSVRPIAASVYQMIPVARSMSNSPPSQRYIDIIIKGCQFYGVPASWTDWLASHPATARKPEKDWGCFVVAADTPSLPSQVSTTTSHLTLPAILLQYSIHFYKIIDCTTGHLHAKRFRRGTPLDRH
jgi:hypothetical protein